MGCIAAALAVFKIISPQPLWGCGEKKQAATFFLKIKKAGFHGTLSVTLFSVCTKSHRFKYISFIMAENKPRWKKIAFSPQVIRRACLTSLVVGTVLTLINQGGLIIKGGDTSDLFWKIPLTYLVPYLVTTWGALTRLD